MSIQNSIQVQVVSPVLMNSLLDFTQQVSTAWHLSIDASANSMVEDLYYCDNHGNRMLFLGQFSVAPEYDSNKATISGRINPGKSIYAGSIPYLTLATPLVKFIPSVSNKRYCVIIKVLSEYVFETPEYNFLRFMLYIDGEERAVRTLSVRQMAEIEEGCPGIAFIDGQGDGRHFCWKDIKVDNDNDSDDAEEHDAWNYELGTIRVYVERCREEEGEVSGEDGEDESDGEEEEEEEEEGEEGEEGEEDEWNTGCLEVMGEEEDAAMEMEDAKGEEQEEEEEREEDDDTDDGTNDEDDDELTMHKVNIEERHLSHFTATIDAGGTLAPPCPSSGRCVDGESFLIFDFKYRSSKLLRKVALMPQ